MKKDIEFEVISNIQGTMGFFLNKSEEVFEYEEKDIEVEIPQNTVKISALPENCLNIVIENVNTLNNVTISSLSDDCLKIEYVDKPKDKEKKVSILPESFFRI